MASAPPRRKKTKPVVPYDLAVLNADLDTQAIVDGLAVHPEARLCLYGPPGTGKTAFAHFLAGHIGRPLINKRASDLLGRYVGESEHNIARAFSQARSDGGVLLFDEADSFLRDRANARNTWEVTLVNELLTQMESFNGIFICSTNLMDEIDSASLRRFDLKIYFDFMKPTQLCSLFSSTLAHLNVDSPVPDELFSRLKQNANLTPGDFATVVRQARISLSGLTPETLLDGLVRESQLKDIGAGRGMGFMAEI